jgi:hypothetical protein
MPISGFSLVKPLSLRRSVKCRSHWKICDALGLQLREDPAVRLIAEKIIELAQRGVRDAPTLRAIALKNFSSEAA